MKFVVPFQAIHTWGADGCGKPGEQDMHGGLHHFGEMRTQVTH